MTGHAGLVGTQNIRNNESREGGLDHVVTTGTIVEAVENQPWSGEANVSVSIANWVKTQDAALLPKKRKLWFKIQPSASAKKTRKRGSGSATKEYELDVRECDQINSALSDETDVAGAKVLETNRKPKRCFEGQQPGHEGFRLNAEERAKLFKDEDASTIVFAYINGTDLLTDGFAENPSFIIDFGTRNMLEASAFPKTLEIIRQRVLPDWEKNAAAEQEDTGKSKGEHQGRLETWWLLKRRRGELLDSISKMSRFVACSRVTKRPVFSFLSSEVHPDSSLTCFAFEDDYSFGILQSHTHWLWFVTKCSKLTERFRYTPDTVFDTFPWPQFDVAAGILPAVEGGILPSGPTSKAKPPGKVHADSAGLEATALRQAGCLPPQAIAKIDAVAAAAREVRRVRAEALRDLKGGLRTLYCLLELPGANLLKGTHAALERRLFRAMN